MWAAGTHNSGTLVRFGRPPREPGCKVALYCLFMGKKRQRQTWPEAKKLCRLNQNDIEMAKRLGFGPDALIHRPEILYATASPST